MTRTDASRAMRRRLPPVVLSLLLFAIGICLVVAAVHAWSTPSGDCNNEIGQCIRERQRIVIESIALLYTIAGTGTVGVAVATGLAPKITTTQIVLTALGALHLLRHRPGRAPEQQLHRLARHSPTPLHDELNAAAELGHAGSEREDQPAR
jgi:uncharacterized membrane protein YphA (DoxX/SURF4 family)